MPVGLKHSSVIKSIVVVIILLFCGVQESAAQPVQKNDKKNCDIIYNEENSFNLSLYSSADTYSAAKALEPVFDKESDELVKEAGLKDTIPERSESNIGDDETGRSKFGVFNSVSYSTKESREKLLGFFISLEPKGIKAVLRSKKYVASDLCPSGPFYNMKPIRQEDIPAFCESIKQTGSYTLYISGKDSVKLYSNLDERLKYLEATVEDVLRKKGVERPRQYHSELTVIPAPAGTKGEYTVFIKLGYSVWGTEASLTDIAVSLNDAGIKAVYSLESEKAMFNICPETLR